MKTVNSKILQNVFHMTHCFLGLSMLQNGKIPTFLAENDLEQIFGTGDAVPCFVELRKGFQILGIYQVKVDCKPFAKLNFEFCKFAKINSREKSIFFDSRN